MESKYLKFEFIRDTGKTKVFDVRNKQGNYLGEVKWYGPWRRYVFCPPENDVIIFDVNCLNDIALFMKELMSERANKLVELIKNS